MKAKVSITMLIAIFVFVGVAANASASGLDSLPQAMANALEISESAAKMLIGTMILMSAGLCLAIADANVIVDATVMIAIVALLVLIGWFYQWTLVVIVILIIAMFARDPMSEWFNKSGGG